MEIEAEILGEDLLLEDVVEQAAIARAEEDRVMRDLGVTTSRSEVPDEEPHRVAHLLDASIRPFPAHRGIQQVAIRPRGVGVRHDDVRRERLTGRETNADRAPSVDEDPIDRRVTANGASLPFDETNETVDES